MESEMGKNPKKGKPHLSLSMYRRGLTNSRLQAVCFFSKICKRVWCAKIWAAKPPAGELRRRQYWRPHNSLLAASRSNTQISILQSPSRTHRLPSKRETAGSLNQFPWLIKRQKIINKTYSTTIGQISFFSHSWRIPIHPIGKRASLTLFF